MAGFFGQILGEFLTFKFHQNISAFDSFLVFFSFYLILAVLGKKMQKKGFANGVDDTETLIIDIL